MPDLAETQGRFAQALNGAGAQETCPDLFVGAEHDVVRRLAVYRGNLMGTGCQALAAAYPVIVRVVGADFFEAMARAYLAHSPSASGDLNQYGSALPAFLEEFAPVRELAYLPDLARLEWAVHRAHYGADSAELDLTRLASVTEAQQPSLRLKLNPLCTLLASRYPLARIWEIHQTDYAGEFSVQFENGPFHALVLRPRFRAHGIAIEVGEYTFLCKIAAGAILSDALDQALLAEPAFDLEAALRRWVELLVLTDFF